MPDYLLSDVHLRLDRPDRGRRLARLLDSLSGDDRVVIVGDLCDFWFASREDRRQAGRCPGLRALRAFQSRGGRLRVMLGNHDAWLGPFYESLLAVPIDPEPLLIESFGLRIRLEHGHHRRGTPFWKMWMEGRTFLSLFRTLPGWLARALERRLNSVNDAKKAESNRIITDGYRAFARDLPDPPDLVVFGHAHCIVDEPVGPTRLVVLGEWLEQASYLVIDEAGARLVIHTDQDGRPRPALQESR